MGYNNFIFNIKNVFNDNFERPHGYSQGGRYLELRYEIKFWIIFKLIKNYKFFCRTLRTLHLIRSIKRNEKNGRKNIAVMLNFIE